MKKKSIILTLALVAAFSAGSAVVVQQAYHGDAVRVAADDTKTALTVKDVNFTNYAGWAGNCIAIGCNEGTLIDGNFTTLTDAETQTGKVSLIDKDGNPCPITYLEAQGSYIVVNRSQAYVCSVGDILTLKAGLIIGNFEIKEDISYQYGTENTPWTVYTGALPTPPAEGGGEEVVEKKALNVLNVNYTPNLLDFAGACIVIGCDTNLGLGDWQQIDLQGKVTLTESNGTERPITLFDSVGTSLLINRSQTYVCSVGDILTLKAGLVVGEFELKEDVSYKYTTAGSPWTVYTGEEEPEPETELMFATVEGQAYPYNANYLHNLNWGYPSMIFKFNTAKTLGLFGSVATLDLIEYKNAYGEIIPIRDCIHVNENNYLLRWGQGEEQIFAMAGDTVTFKKGFAIAGNEKLAQDMTFIVTAAADSQLAPYSEELAPTGLAITTSSDYSQITVGAQAQMTYTIASGIGTAYFTSSNEEVATVTKEGIVTGVAEGEVTITAHLGTETKEFAMTILPASPIVGVELVHNYTVWVAQNEALALPEFRAHIVFENGQSGADFALTADNCVLPEVDTSALGDQNAELTVTYQGVEYKVAIKVTVYEIGDVTVREIGIVDWFAYAVFIQYPDSTANTANITGDIGKLDGIFDHITYTKADGSDLPIESGYVLSGGNIAIFPYSGLTEENYNEYFLAGDTITLSKGMKIWMWTGEKMVTDTDNNAIVAGTGMYICEGILQEDLVYRYDGNVWGLYVEYTDIQAKATDITVEAGKSADSNVSRIPENATTGTFTYVSSDETIATVSSRGVIKGVSAGTCTITVTIDGGTAGAKTVVLNVTVTDDIVGIEIATESITIKVGELPDLSSVSATWKWASGKQGEAVDLTNATLVGFDGSVAGEQQVAISVTKDGKTYTGTLTIIVEEPEKKEAAGCLSSISAGVVAPVMMLGAGLIVSKKKRK